MFEYVTKLNAIINILKDANTTTSSPDLSYGLSTRIDNNNILADDPERIQIRSDRMPAVFVRMSLKDENFEGLGEPGSMKEATVVFDVIGFYAYEGMHSDSGSASTEIYNLARNIEAVFQQKPDLNRTALWCNPRRSDFLGTFDMDAKWVKVVLVELEAKYYFKYGYTVPTPTLNLLKGKTATFELWDTTPTASILTDEDFDNYTVGIGSITPQSDLALGNIIFDLGAHYKNVIIAYKIKTEMASKTGLIIDVYVSENGTDWTFDHKDFQTWSFAVIDIFRRPINTRYIKLVFYVVSLTVGPVNNILNFYEIVAMQYK